MEKRYILAVDDDPTQIELLNTICSDIEYPEVEFSAAETGAQALGTVRERAVDMVFLDYRLPDMTGLEVLRAMKAHNPLVAVVVMTAYESTEQAVEALKSGADDYLVKPTSAEQISHVILRITESQALDRETAELEDDIEEDFDAGFITFKSREMARALNLAARSAKSAASVLLRGESGTGKELFARIIHSSSERAEQPFVAVNVAALPETLVESELFGHVKGSFTGATQDRVGRFEEADGGTLFIDEIGDVSGSVQVKLLRAIQFGEVQRVGANQPMKLDVRIITATNRNLEEMIRQGTFREDLYYRLNVIQIDLPPLRDRKTDIPPLVDQFIARYAEKNRKQVDGITFDGLDLLMKYDFPGNVRELENIIERSVVLCRGTRLTSRDLPDALRKGTTPTTEGRSSGKSLDAVLAETETQLILDALSRTEGNQSRAAALLDVSERKLRSRMQRLGLENIYADQDS